MQPVSGNQRRGDTISTPLADATRGDVHFGMESNRQLPRFVRRSIRLVKGLTPMRVVKSRGLQMFVLGAAVLGASGYVLKSTDQTGILATASAHVGFEASKLVVNGHQNLDMNVLQARLGSQLGNSLFSFGVDKARDAVLSDPWVKSATVKKVYPDTIVVNVVERKPVALWQSRGEIQLIAADGFVIGKASPEHMVLPQVVGDGANISAAEFLSVMDTFPAISQKANAYVRVAGRRWNIRLADGPQVLLPEFDWHYALSDLQEMQKQNRILDRDVVQIDMRLPDRLVIKLDPEMADVRRAAIEKSIKKDWHKS